MLILLVALAGYSSLKVLESKAETVISSAMRMQRLALEMETRLQLARQAERDFVLRLPDLGVQGVRSVYGTEFFDRLSEASRNVIWLQEFEQFNSSGSVLEFAEVSSQQLALIRQRVGTYSELFRKLSALAANGDKEADAFEYTLAELDSEYIRLTSMVHQFSIAVADGARNAQHEISHSGQYTGWFVLASVFVALAVAVGIVLVLNRTVAESVVRLSDTASELSQGNFDARVEVRGEDEFGRLAVVINDMAARITTLVDDLEGQATIASDRLVDAIDSISEGFTLLDTDNRLVLANQLINQMVVVDVTGYPVGTPMDRMLREGAKSGVFLDAVGREEEWVQERLARLRIAGAVTEDRMQDGRWITTKVSHTKRGETVILTQDITNQKRRGSALEAMNSDLEALVRDRTRVLVEKATELKQANLRLKELDELKSSFLSSVSHELRTPLTSLLGFSKIIKRDFLRIYAPNPDDAQSLKLGKRIEGNLDIIRSEGERLTRLINDVLDLSRIESGQEEWIVKKTDMAGVIHRAIEASSGLFSAKKGVSLVVRRFDVVPPVMADADRLHQVLINLLSNAVKFTDAGKVLLDLYLDERGMAHVCVEDSGEGIEPQYLESIFDKFHQAHRGDTLSQRPGGTGLGLAISRQIVERYGGTIWAESGATRGSRFHVTLPIVQDAESPGVLVVDDDPAAREYMSFLIRRAGYAVWTAADGSEALSCLEQYRPALVIMDLNMPIMDGQTAIEELRKMPRFKALPVLAVSVAPGSGNVGGDAMLLKPIKGDVLVQTVHALLRKEPVMQDVLVLGDASAMGDVVREFLVGGAASYCTEAEMWKELDAGFQGVVVILESLVETIDFETVRKTELVQVVLLPDLSSDEAGAEPVAGRFQETT